MIDTILISQSNYSIPEITSYWEEIKIKNFEGEYCRYFFNTEFYRITIRPLQNKVFIECSLPKIMKKNNGIISELEYFNALDNLQDMVENQSKLKLEK